MAINQLVFTSYLLPTNSLDFDLKEIIFTAAFNKETSTFVKTMLAKLFLLAISITLITSNADNHPYQYVPDVIDSPRR